MIQKGNNQQNKNQYILSQKSHNNPHTIFNPEPFPESQSWYHPILGYPMCPLIGRYNKGQYRIADVILHLEFVCSFNDESDKNQTKGMKKDVDWFGYKCGNRYINLPQFIVYNLRNIPEVINYNKPKNMKTQPDVHLTHHLVQKNIKVNWIISFGQIGKDFLNYLNHCYIFDESVFFGQKLNRTTYNLPIMAYMPEGSGLIEEEVERGISTTAWRSQYMSIHLKGGAPAFSPNNMRLGVAGMKKIVSNAYQNNNTQKNKDNKNKKKYKAKYEQKKVEQKIKEEVQIKKDPQLEEQIEIQKYEQLSLWQQIQEDEKHVNSAKENKPIQQKHENLAKTSAKFVHFYTSVLLQNDHRVYYHWVVEDENMQQMIKQIYANARSVQQFGRNYEAILGNDPLIRELRKLLVF